MRPLPPLGIVLLVACALAGCQREVASVAPDFAVVRTAPPRTGGGVVLLNQELTVYFSAPVDPLSITSDTVYVLDEAGHRIPGGLRTGSQSVAFVPVPPLRPDLQDGSFRPNKTYRLVVSGYPRHDAVKARQGGMLTAGLFQEFRTVGEDVTADGFRTPLLPVGSGIDPFLLRQGDGPGRLPADAGSLRLHFTTPVLPTSVRLEALEVSLLRSRLQTIKPRGLRLLSLPPPVDHHPGSTLEIVLGRDVRLVGEVQPTRLQPGDMIIVVLRREVDGLLDYGGRPLSGPDMPASWWEVVAGEVAVHAAWPAGSAAWVGPDPLLPGFEVLRDGVLRPQLRAEAGTGALGVFRPQAAVELRPGVPFDRGDGTLVTSEGDVFPFLAIDIPAGVTVRVLGAGRPVLLQACGSVRIAGRLELDVVPVDLPLRPAERVSARTLLDATPAAIVAGGDLLVLGSIRTTAPGIDPEADLLTSVVLVAGGRIELQGPIPRGSVLAVEGGNLPLGGAAEQATPVVVELTPGLPAGVTLDCVGASPWRQLPPDRDGAIAEVDEASSGLQVAIQFAPPNPLRPDQPDTFSERWSQPQSLVDQLPLAFPPGSFVRVVVLGQAVGGAPLPSLRGLRLRDRQAMAGGR